MKLRKRRLRRNKETIKNRIKKIEPNINEYNMPNITRPLGDK